MTSSLSVLHNQLNTNESNKLSTLECSKDAYHYACLMGTKLLIKFVVHTKFLSIKSTKHQLSTFTTLAVHAHAHPTKIEQVSNSLQKTSVNSYRHSICKLSIVMVLSTTFTQFAPETTKFRKITLNKGHFAVQGHSTSPILVPIESSYTTSY